MPGYRRVAANRAGPTALGILVPPGKRTWVILRPRALEWDLLPTQLDSRAFCEFERDEAALLARKVQGNLEQGPGTEPARLIVKATGYEVWVPLGDFLWIVCARRAGRPYQPLVFPSRDEAVAALDRVALSLWPAAGAEQEYYFNTQNFNHDSV
jgi:hypothetical protein